MSYTSKYTGEQIDNTLGKVSIIEGNVTSAQNDINIVLNTKIPNLSTRIDGVQASLNSLSTNLSTDFIDTTIYNQQIGEINAELDAIQTDLEAIFSELDSKVAVNTFGARIGELAQEDELLLGKIAEGDQAVLQSSQELVNANTSRIVSLETASSSQAKEIASIKNEYATTSALNSKSTEILNSIASTCATQESLNSANDTINSLATAVQTINNNYVTLNNLNEKEQSILNSIASTYVSSSDLSTNYLNKTELNNTYVTKKFLEENYVLKTTYEAKIQKLENAIKALSN